MKVSFTKQMFELGKRNCITIEQGCKMLHLALIPFKSMHGSWVFGIRKIKPRETYTIIYPLNPIPRIKHDLSWMLQSLYLKLTDQEYKECQGCGEGIAKWKIRDPNHGSGNRYFNCCNGCVTFYDFRMSRMKIVGWKNRSPIAKKNW